MTPKLSFSDEQWKQLLSRAIFHYFSFDDLLSKEMLASLLYRLECAENFINSVCINEATVQQDRYLQAWKQSKAEGL